MLVRERGNGTEEVAANEGCDRKQPLLWVTRAESCGGILGNGVEPRLSPTVRVRMRGCVAHSSPSITGRGLHWEMWVLGIISGV